MSTTVHAFCESDGDNYSWKIDGELKLEEHGVRFKFGRRTIFVPYHNIMYIEKED